MRYYFENWSFLWWMFLCLNHGAVKAYTRTWGKTLYILKLSIFISSKKKNSPLLTRCDKTDHVTRAFRINFGVISFRQRDSVNISAVGPCFVFGVGVFSWACVQEPLLSDTWSEPELGAPFLCTLCTSFLAMRRLKFFPDRFWKKGLELNFMPIQKVNVS
jgi:hypothetical protein